MITISRSQAKRVIQVMILLITFAVTLVYINMPVAALKLGHEVIIVDESVANSDRIVENAPKGATVIFASDESNGFDQVCAALSNEKDLAAIHIISHGSQGRLYLGNSVLSMDTINHYRAQLETIGNSLCENGDLLIYGCDVAKGMEGHGLIQEISSIAGANVTGSDDITSGNREKGDSILEVSVGSINTPTIDFSGWNGVLANVSKSVPLNADVELTISDLGYEPSFASSGYIAVYFDSLPGANSMLGTGSAGNRMESPGYNYLKTSLEDPEQPFTRIHFMATEPGTYSFNVCWTGNSHMIGNKIPPVSPLYTITITVPNPAPTGIKLSNSNAPAGYDGLRITRLTGEDNSNDSNTFSIVTDTSNLFTVANTNTAKRQGVLSFQPGKTLAAGATAAVTVRVTDSLNQSFDQTFTITGVAPTKISVKPSATYDVTYDGGGFYDESGYMPPETGKGTLNYKNSASYTDLSTAINDNGGLYWGDVLGYTAGSAEGQDTFSIDNTYYIVSVENSVNFTATTLTNPTYQTAYSQTINAATGCSGAYTYSITAGALPTGLSFNSVTRTISGTPTSNAGSYTFTITAVDSVDSSKTKSAEFSLVIAKANPTISTWPTTSTITYGQTFAEAIGNNGSASVPGTFSIADASTVPGVVGSPYAKTVTFAPTDATNYHTVTSSVSVTVSRANAEIADITCPDKSYDGNPLSPSSSVTKGDGSIVYTYSGTGIPVSTTTAPIGVGNYAVTATLAESANYNAAVKTTNVMISKGNQSSFAITNKPASSAYGDTFTLGTTGALSSGSITWNAIGGASITAGGEVTITGMNQVTITATIQGDGNYNEATDTYIITPVKASPNIGTVSATWLYVGEDLASSNLSRTNATVSGTLSWDVNPTFASSVSGNVLATYIFTPADTEKYSTLTGQVTVAINTKKVTGISAQTAISDKYYGSAQSTLGLPASIEVTAAGRSGPETKTVPVTWAGYDPHTLAAQTLTGTINLNGNAELNNSDSLSATMSLTLQPIPAKNINSVSAKIKVGSIDGTALLKALVTNQFDGSVDTVATNAASWVGFPANYDAVTVANQSFTVRVYFVAGSTMPFKDVSISFEIVNPDHMEYTTQTIPAMEANNVNNETEAKLLAYVNSYTALTATWPAEAIGTTSVANNALDYMTLPNAYNPTGTTYSFSQTYLGKTIHQNLTITEVKQAPPLLTVNYDSERINTTPDMAYSTVSGVWNRCTADMSISLWLGKTVSFKTEASGFNIDSEIVQIAFPAREAAPSSLRATINDGNTEITVSGLTNTILYEYSYDGVHYSVLPANGKTTIAAYQNNISVRKMYVAGTSARSEVANIAVNYVMNFSTGEGSPISGIYAISGTMVSAPTAPTRSGHSFAGWYSTSNFAAGSEVVYPYLLTGNVTVFAKWNVSSNTGGSSSGSFGGGAVATPSTPKPTTIGDTTSVTTEVKPTTSGSTASATVSKEIMTNVIAAAIAAAEKSKTTANVTLAVTAVKDATAVTATVPVASVDNLADAKTDCSLTLQTPLGSVTLDDRALTTIADKATGAEVSVSIAKVDSKSLTTAQQALVGDRPVIDLTITSAGKNISTLGGTATVSVPYTPAVGEDTSRLVVWYLADNGSLTPMDCSYSNGKLTFSTTHFSKYVVAQFAFSDVKGGDWFYTSVAAMQAKALMNGISSERFAPQATTSRGMIVTMLHRLANKPETTANVNFSDTESSDYYFNAVRWANEKGIVKGIADDKFAPNGSVTREQLITILYRYAGSPAVSATTDMSKFSDASKISDFATQAFAWAVQKGIIGGNADGTLNPNGTATRAEVATMFNNFISVK